MTNNRKLIILTLFAGFSVFFILKKISPVDATDNDDLKHTNSQRSQPSRSTEEIKSFPRGTPNEDVFPQAAETLSASELEEAERRLIEIFLGSHGAIVRARDEIKSILLSLENSYGTENTALFLIKSLGSGDALPIALKTLFKSSKESPNKLIDCYSNLNIGDAERSGAFEMLATRVLAASPGEFLGLWEKLLASPLPKDSGQQLMESGRTAISGLAEKFLSNDFSDEAMAGAMKRAFGELRAKSDEMSPELRVRYMDSLLSGYGNLDPYAAFKSLIENDPNSALSETRGRLVAMVMRGDKVEGSLEILKAGGASKDLKIVGGYWAEASTQQFAEFFESSLEKLDIEQKIALTSGFAQTQIARGNFSDADSWVEWIKSEEREGSETSKSLELRKEEYVSKQMALNPQETLGLIVKGELGSVATLEIAFERWLSSSKPEEAANWLTENSRDLSQEMQDSTSMAYVKYASNSGNFDVADSWIENISDPAMRERAEKILVEKQNR